VIGMRLNKTLAGVIVANRRGHLVLSIACGAPFGARVAHHGQKPDDSAIAADQATARSASLISLARGSIRICTFHIVGRTI